MKKALFSFSFLLFSLFMFSNASAQMEGNIFHVQTLKFQMPEGGSWAEFDSLTALVTKNVTKKQNRIVSQRMLTHLWGSSNRQLIVITEYKKIEDLVGEFTDGDDLFAAGWATKPEQENFDKAYNKYWRVEHADEIYRELPGGRK
jgi:hypothetical protein